MLVPAFAALEAKAEEAEAEAKAEAKAAEVKADAAEAYAKAAEAKAETAEENNASNAKDLRDAAKGARRAADRAGETALFLRRAVAISGVTCFGVSVCLLFLVFSQFARARLPGGRLLVSRLVSVRVFGCST